jgi:isopentenyl-diphosphate delta-isomerase
MQEATSRRLREELDLEAELEFVYKFSYHARFDASGSERELCWVFLGRTAEEALPNAHEIADLRWFPADRLQAILERDQQEFTPWFRLEWEALVKEHAARLQKYQPAVSVK